MRRRLLASFAAVLFLSACSTAPPDWRPTRDQILTAFEVPPPAPDPDSRPPLNLYIDTSQSMQGFVAKPASRYCKVVQDLWTQTLSGQYNAQLTKFSEGFGTLPNVGLAELCSSAFYTGTDTPLSILLARVASDLQSGNLAVIVSDMVQSEATRDQTALIRQLQNALAQGHPEVLLLGFRSAFDGTYPFEAAPKGHIPLHLADDPNQGRPFYVLVFAPTIKDLQTFRRLVLNEVGGEVSFQATEPPLAPQVVRVVGSEDTSAVWQRNSKTIPLPGYSPAANIIDFFQEMRNPPSTGSSLELKYVNKVNMRPHSLPDLRMTAEKATFQRGRHPIQRQPVEMQILFSGKLEPSKTQTVELFATYSGLPRPAPGTWDVYHIEISAGAGNLDAPAWVDDWSTPNDSSAAEGNRTFNLKPFILAMVRAMSENAVFSDHFIALGRGPE
jgi:hypothetical protein